MFGVVSKLRNYIWDSIVRWLTYETSICDETLSNFDRLRYELRPGDVLLVEGRSRVSEIIKIITQSIWTHSILYVGRLHDIDDPEIRDYLQQHYKAEADDQLVVESLLGEGTIIDSLEKYRGQNLRICRPKGLTRTDAQHVINYGIHQLGTDYDIRHLLDLARFMFPYGILPRRWRSSLFEHNAGRPTRTVCSTMMAEAFATVHFPIRPVLNKDAEGKLKLFRRNTKLITPPDFDYSPYFDVIKYPLMDFDELAVYKTLPWDRTGVHCNETGDCFEVNSNIVDYTEPGADEKAAEKSTVAEPLPEKNSQAT